MTTPAPRRVKRPARKPAVMTPLVVRIPSTVLRLLKKEAKQRGVTLSFLAREALAAAISGDLL